MRHELLLKAKFALSGSVLTLAALWFAGEKSELVDLLGFIVMRALLIVLPLESTLRGDRLVRRQEVERGRPSSASDKRFL